MKINYPDPSTVPFSSLNNGDVFEYRGYIHIKITSLITENGVYNSYNLSVNNVVCLSGSIQVTPYPNATLNLT